MNTPTLSFPLRRTGASMRRTRRTTRFALHCEPLESRQLLSVGQSGFAASAVLNAAITAAQIPVPAQVSNPPQASFSVIDVEFGSLSGVIQLQIIVFGNGGRFLADSGAFVRRKRIRTGNAERNRRATAIAAAVRREASFPRARPPTRRSPR